MDRLAFDGVAALLSDRVGPETRHTASISSIVSCAQANGVAPLLLDRVVASRHIDQFPASDRAALQVACYADVAHTLVIQSELWRILAVLLPHMPVILLKGVALGYTLYDSPTLRPSNDIDLLIHEGDVSAAITALCALGYQDVPELSPGLNRVVEYHSTLHGGPHQKITVELHWRLVGGAADRLAPSIEWFWQHTDCWPVETLPDQLAPYRHHTLQLDPTAHVLYLAAHLMIQHGLPQARLIWIYDIHLLLQRCGSRIDWDELVERARAYSWTAAVHAALCLAQQCFDSTIPNAVLETIASMIDRQEITLVQARMHAAGDPVRGEILKRHLLKPSARLRFIASLLVPKISYLRWRYPQLADRHDIAHYLHHWTRLVHAVVRLVKMRRSPTRSAAHEL